MTVGKRTWVVQWPAPATPDDSDEADRQMIVLALAELALRRPGWDWTLRRLAGRLSGADDFDAFKKTSADIVRVIVNCQHPRAMVVTPSTAGYPYKWCPDCNTHLGPVNPDGFPRMSMPPQAGSRG